LWFIPSLRSGIFQTHEGVHINRLSPHAAVLRQ
jgi:hypothetical protein